MFQGVSEMIEEDKIFFNNFLKNSTYNQKYSRGFWGDISIPQNKNLFYVFKDDWRSPLNLPELYLFKILCQMSIKGSPYNLISHFFSISKERLFSDFKVITLSLRKKGYVKFAIKYKQHRTKKYVKDHFNSRMKIYCYDPKGNVVNHNNASQLYKRF